MARAPGIPVDTSGVPACVAHAIDDVLPEMLDHLPSHLVSRWCELAASFADRSTKVAVAFVEATPGVLAHLEPSRLDEWAAQGRRLDGGGWASAGLAARYFAGSAELLGQVSIEELEHIVAAASTLADRSQEVAASCVRDAPATLARLERSDRGPYLELVGAVAHACWADTDRCLERTPALLAAIEPPARAPLLGIAVAAVATGGRDAFDEFITAAEALARVPATAQEDLVAFAATISPTSPAVALGMLTSAPAVRTRVSPELARRWCAAGLELLTDPDGEQRAVSWFRLESSQSTEMLASLAGRVELTEVASLLRLYAQALSGERLLLQPRTVLDRRGIGWRRGGRSTTDGVSIFLPSSIDTFDDHAANFQAYKVHATHQACRLDFGSFRFELGRDGAHLPATTHLRKGTGLPATAAPIRRYYDLFDDPKLIAWIFALVEGTRIDACLDREYPGIRHGLHRMQDHEAALRPDPARLPAREAFAESLVLASLGRGDLALTALVGSPLQGTVGSAFDALDIVRRPLATVQDSAEVAAMLYDSASSVPNLAPSVRPLQVPRKPGGPAGPTEAAFEMPSQPDFRGEFNPELVQLLESLEAGTTAGAAGQIDRDQVLDLLAGSPEIDVPETDRSQLATILDNLIGEATDRRDVDDPPITAEQADGEVAEPSDGITWYRYDEWDHRAHDYRPRYCRLGERRAIEGDLGFYEETLSQHHGLVLETRRRFEQMRPEAFRRIKRLEDGQEIDLDEAIQFHADKRAGAGPLARIYMRRNKVVRDVAVALLLDMSGSTNEEMGSEGKRIIDIEKESTVLMIEALQAIGDSYGIYGFSGEGHESVELHVVKELGEAFDDRVRRRLDGIEPVRATRMGPAIRHTIRKLDEYPSKVKILILVSDGRPQDDDYGPDRGEIEYALHDTKKALVEAKRRHIEPFLITVDCKGHEYLGQMCDDIGYEVVTDIESLPRRLPRLYRYLAAE